jgi:hypothetical protein
MKNANWIGSTTEPSRVSYQPSSSKHFARPYPSPIVKNAKLLNIKTGLILSNVSLSYPAVYAVGNGVGVSDR